MNRLAPLLLVSLLIVPTACSRDDQPSADSESSTADRFPSVPVVKPGGPLDNERAIGFLQARLAEDGRRATIVVAISEGDGCGQLSTVRQEARGTTLVLTPIVGDKPGIDCSSPTGAAGRTVKAVVELAQPGEYTSIIHD